MSPLTFIFGRILTIFADKQGSKAGNLAKYVHLQQIKYVNFISLFWSHILNFSRQISNNTLTKVQIMFLS